MKTTKGKNEMKKQLLSRNSRQFTHMAMNVGKTRTVIYIHGLSKTNGASQWYQTNTDFTNNTALNYVRGGKDIKLTNSRGGISKSKKTDWLTEDEIKEWG